MTDKYMFAAFGLFSAYGAFVSTILVLEGKAIPGLIFWAASYIGAEAAMSCYNDMKHNEGGAPE